MKKNHELIKTAKMSFCISKIVRILNITAILMIFATLQVFAEESNSQSINKDQGKITAEAIVKLQPKTVTGVVVDESGVPYPGVYVTIKGTTRGSMTDIDGKYSLEVEEPDAVLVYSFVGTETQEIQVGSQTEINVTLVTEAAQLQDIVVVGYGVQRKESLTGAIAGVEMDKLDPVKSNTVSAMFAGMIPGVSFKQVDSRPGANASIQIRNFGTPLIIVDGFEKTLQHFNNINPSDIESISVLKDASAAIYGVRAGNGVIIVTTKRGKENTRSKINVSAYQGWKNWLRGVPENVNDSYTYMLGVAHAQMNALNPSTAVTPAELAKYKAGTEYGYGSFNWRDFVIEPNAPSINMNINLSGGSDHITHYISLSHMNEKALMGREFEFFRTNLQSNFDIKITDRLTIGSQIHARIEGFDQPGVPGGDDYQNPMQILQRNRPTERAYANDNPDYVENIGHNAQQWALFTKSVSGYSGQITRVIQPNFSLDYDIPVDGLTFRASYSYGFHDILMNEHEYTYDVYTYRPLTDEYDLTFANTNPWRRRYQNKRFENMAQARLNYRNTFGDHNIEATLATERIDVHTVWDRYNAYPKTNVLPLIYFDDLIAFVDVDEESARIGYIGRANYSYSRKYYLELVGRYDGSWKFSADKRWGFFPSVSAGWRITEEAFMSGLTGASGLDLKIRGSYGVVGDDNVGIGDYDYVTGYQFGISNQVVDNQVTTGSRDKGVPITNVTWFTSTITNIGIDFSFMQNKINGSIDAFNRVRDGLTGVKYDILVPAELGYTLPIENVNSDGVKGIDGSIEYNGTAGELGYRIGINASISRPRQISTYKPRFGSSWDEYRNGEEDRWSGVRWGYEQIGVFQTQEEVNNYPVNIDGQGNKTLLPGDLIYKDENGDGIIDGMDQRPIGYPEGRFAQPIVSFGLINSLNYKGFDMSINLSGGAMSSYQLQRFDLYAFRQTGGLQQRQWEEAWRRTDPFDVNSAWIKGTIPPLRYNNSGHSSVRGNSTFWQTNVWYIRARTISLGYTLPSTFLQKFKIDNLRVYLNTYNLFSIDNMKKYNLDPEVERWGYRNYGQTRNIAIGFDLTF
jgi:TonB-linked SusC/RagA family outer membrane protein